MEPAAQRHSSATPTVNRQDISMACCQKRKCSGKLFREVAEIRLDDTDEASKERSREEFRGSQDADEASREHSPEEFQGRWLTYADISRIRGIGRPSAVKLAQREGWERRPGNDGTARILVPVEWLKPAKKETPREPSREELPLLQDALVILRDQLGSADRRAEEAERRAEAAESRADAANKRTDVAAALADRLIAQVTDAERRVDQARAEVRAARQEAEQLRQADTARRGKGTWARLRAAWRGE